MAARKSILPGQGARGQKSRRAAGAGGKGLAGNGFPCGLREMDFLNIPAGMDRPDATAGDSPSGLMAGFW